MSCPGPSKRLDLGKAVGRGTALLIGMILMFSVALSGQDDVDYRDRGDRYEGTRRKPVSAGDIELISAVAGYQEQCTNLRDRFRLKFFLAKTTRVYVTVRELDCVTYYWMDRLVPKSPWQKGFENEFTWPTRDVVQKLKGLTLERLGAVARLDHERETREDYVAPVILYSSSPPTRVDRYVFVVRTTSAALIQPRVFDQRETRVLPEQTYKTAGRRPLALNYDFSSLKAGWYRLVITGYMLDNNDPISRVVHFYHQPLVGARP